jgi:DNA-binding CsgD family transcriptional regulator
VSTVPLIGRSEESASIEMFFDQLPGGSLCLLLEGEVGIGKTTLLNWAKVAAGDRGYRVLSASPVESEVPWEFAALADLLEGVRQAIVDELPEPQRQAIGIAVFRDEVREVAIDPRTLATAVSRILRRLAEETPVVLSIDDLPWLDLPSARVLSYALRRAGSAPVGLLGTVRAEWFGDPGELVTDPVSADRVKRIIVGPILSAPMSDLLAHWTGVQVGRSRLRQVQDLCRGNPLFALELVRGNAFDPSELSRRPDRSVDLPESLRRLVRDRVDRLSPGPRDVSLVTALSDDAELHVVLAAAADPSHAEEDLQRALTAGILQRSGQTLMFAHPLIRSVVASEATEAQRRAAHQRLASVVPHSYARARHLALGAEGPDEAIAQEVEEAATTAASRGACETAATLAELSVLLTPCGRTGDRHRRMALEAENRFDASDPVKACALLEEVTKSMVPGPERAGLLRRLARYLGHRGDPDIMTEWIARLTTALNEAGDDLELRGAIAVDLTVVSNYSGNQVAAAEYGALALDAMRQRDDRAQQAQLYAGMALAAFLNGAGVQQDLVERALSGPEQPLRLSMDLRPRSIIAHLLHLSGDQDAARNLYETEYQQALNEGVVTTLPTLLWGLVETEAWTGNWDRADSLCTEGSEYAAESDLPIMSGFMAGVRGLMHAYRGRVHEELSDDEQAMAIGLSSGSPIVALLGAQGVGIAGLSLGDPAAVHRRLGSITDFIRTVGVAEPGFVRFLPDEIEALIRLGQLDEAIELLSPFESRSDELGRTWGQATSARCRGLLHAARGELDSAAAALDLALDYHATLGMPFEHARTLLVAGEVHRRGRRKSMAKTHLDASLAIFNRLGSPLWAKRASSEIQRLGLRRAPTGSALTETERQVADLTTSGLSNAQIAAQLFVSSRTVEAHLSRIYRKLGVKSRTQMARVYSLVPVKNV